MDSLGTVPELPDPDYFPSNFNPLGEIGADVIELDTLADNVKKEDNPDVVTVSDEDDNTESLRLVFRNTVTTIDIYSNDKYFLATCVSLL